MIKQTLFDLSAEMTELEQKLSDFDGDISEEEKEKEIDDLLARMAENEESINEKLDGYVAVMAEFEGRAELREKEASRLLQLARGDHANTSRLKDRLLSFFLVQGISKRETNFHKFTVAKAGGKQALEIAEGTDVTELPAKFTEVIPEQVVFNKDAIREHLSEGNELEFARLLERKDVLKIR